jgi:hypothetical protein
MWGVFPHFANCVVNMVRRRTLLFEPVIFRCKRFPLRLLDAVDAEVGDIDNHNVSIGEGTFLALLVSPSFLNLPSPASSSLINSNVEFDVYR